MQIIQGSFKYFQVQTHVQTARESPDLNMDFRSFDNGCKQRIDIYARLVVYRFYCMALFHNQLPGRVAQSVTCLATDACLTADPGVASLIPAWSHTFVEIDHEIISTVILLPSADSFKKGCCQLQAKVCA